MLAVDGVVHKYPDCAHFLLVGRWSERLCRRLVIQYDVGGCAICIFNKVEYLDKEGCYNSMGVYN